MNQTKEVKHTALKAIGTNLWQEVEGSIVKIAKFSDFDINGSKEQCEAKLEFIVKACNSHYELLEACKEARANLHDAGHRSGASMVLNQLDKAIAKAE